MEKAIPLCTFKNCNKPASHHYRWEWGEEGNCCAACVTLMQQTAGNLSRGVQFTNLESGAEPPVTRSERTGLVAAKLSAEAEAAELKLRGQQLYLANVDLTQQVQTLTMRAREHKEQLQANADQVEQLSARLDERERELGEAAAERDRLRVLVPFAEPATSRVGERGL